MTEELDHAFLQEQYGHDLRDSGDGQCAFYTGREDLMQDDSYQQDGYYPVAAQESCDATPSAQGSYHFYPQPTDAYADAALSRHFDFDRAHAEGLVAQEPQSSVTTTSCYPSFSQYALDDRSQAFYDGRWNPGIRSQINSDNRGQNHLDQHNQIDSVFCRQAGSDPRQQYKPDDHFQKFPDPRSQKDSIIPSHRNEPIGERLLQYNRRIEESSPSQVPQSVWAEPEPGRKVQLVPVSSLPALYRPLFVFPFFNAIQSLCLPKVLHSKKNIVLSAPTGSGKTVVFELALLRMLTKEPENARAVYLAPTKALCSERTRDWSTRFGPVGCGVTELTGDSVHGLHVARKSRLIITTPEKWDSLTRKWDEQAGILSTIRLVLIDEVHILNEPQRGARLEVVVTRTKNRGNQVRFVAVSATVPNLEDVVRWIGPSLHVERQGQPLVPNATAEIFQFDDSFRPCPLQKHVYGYSRSKDEFAFQSYLNCKLFELVETHAAGRPCLVFCATRRSTFQAANAIVEARKQSNGNAGGIQYPARNQGGQSGLAPLSFDDVDLQTLASSGVAFHHAGLSASDRRTVEKAFVADRIAVLCCTTTLATGVNLPAYCVIIRGTKQFDGKWTEMSELDVIQMMGRAGRPQFDRSGVAVIMCEDTMQAHYRELVSGSRSIESSLAPCLVEHVNAEIGLRGRTTESQIEAWIRQSFMWTRLQKNPTFYLSQDEGIVLDSVQDILKHLVTKTLAALQEASLIVRCEENADIMSTEYGIIMSRFFLRHKTMLALIEMPAGANTRAVLKAICGAEEFGEQRMRQGEKGFLSDLRTHAEIRYPPSQVTRVADKVSLLIQAHLSAINLSQIVKTGVGEASPYMDIKRIIPHAMRVAKAVVDVAIYRCDGVACKAGMDLARSIAAGAWDGSPAMLRQIDQIGERSIKALANAGIATWQALSSSTPAKIEMILNRHPPFGSKVVAAAQSVPRIGLEVMQRSATPSKASSFALPANRVGALSEFTDTAPSGIEAVLDVTIRVENRATCMLKSKTSRMALSICVLMVKSDGSFVDFRRMPIWRFEAEKRFTVQVRLDDPRMRVMTYAACDEVAGTLVQASLLPVDMAKGSHRTRIARAEPHNSSAGGFDADVDDGSQAGSSRSFTDGHVSAYTEGAAASDELGPEGGSSWRRCKHKCKGECRHPCCQQAREIAATGKLPNYRYQSRLPDESSQSTISRYLQPVATPLGVSTATQKRKTQLDPGDDVVRTSRDLLSRLDRQEAEYDRMHGKQKALQKLASSGDNRLAADDDDDAGAIELFPSKRRSTTELSNRRGCHSKDVPRMTDLVNTTRQHDQRHTQRPDERDQYDPATAPTPSRPAQRRFLEGIGPSPWADSSGAAD